MERLNKKSKLQLIKKVQNLEREIKLLKSNTFNDNTFQAAERYESLFKSFYDGITISDIEANIIDVNDSLVKMYGYNSKEEIIGTNAAELIREDNRLLIQDYIKTIIEHGGLGGIELVCIKKDGSEFTVEISASVIYDKNNDPKQFISITKDITARKEIKKTLSERDQFYHTLFELSPSGILLEDLDGNILDSNPAMSKALGYPGEDLIGKNVRSFSHPDRIGEVEEHLKKLNSGELLEHSVKNMGHDGKISYMYLTERKVKIPAGREGILCIAKDVTELKNTDDALKESVENYKNLMSQSPLAIEVLDKDGILREVNKAWEELWQVKAEEVINKYSVFNNPLLEKMGMMDAISKSFQGDKIDLPDVFFDPQIAGMPGRKRWLQTKVYSLKDPDGAVKNVVLIHEDVTSRKNSENYLKQNESRYKQLFDNSPVPLWEEDYSEIIEYLEAKKKSGISNFLEFFEQKQDQLKKCVSMIKVINVNKAAVVLYKAQNKDQLLNNIEKTFTENSYRIFKYELASIAEGINNYQSEIEIKILNGEKISVHFSRNLGENGLAIIATQDLTEIKKAQQALIESEERFRTTFNNAADSIFLIEMSDKGALIMDANEAAHKSHGYDKSELIGLPISVLEDDESSTRNPNRVERILAGEHMVYETSDKRKDGSCFPIEVSARKVLVNGKPYIYSIERDISDRKKLEKQLVLSQKMEALGTLAGGIAHDFNNILAAILGYSELTMDEVPDDSLAQANLKAIMNAGVRAKELVEQILTFSRQKENTFKPVKVNILVKEAVKFLHSSIPSTIELQENIDPGCPMVMADPSHIHQIVMNLCTNAYQAIGEENGLIKISLSKISLNQNNMDLPEGEYLKLVVQDSGKGIDKAVYDKIFDPFFTTKNIGEGSGLGLSVVHGIINSLKGEISVSNANPGTIFTVYLPTVQVIESPMDSFMEEVVGGNETILLVEDDKMVSNVTGQLLESLGYRVTVMNDSVQSLKVFKNNPDSFDLVITDQIMPGLTGLNLSLELMKIRKEILIILMSGYSETIDEEIVYDLGIKGYINKPVGKRTLGKLTREILDKN
ncbi:MAG: PAS domain S-box protein [Calditrichaeota bacterium]|nr:PAS domain S-box protein [Calditrichota bacterium]